MLQINLNRFQIFALFIIGIIIIFLGIYAINKRTNELTNQKYLETTQEMQHTLQTYIDEKKDAMLLIAHTLAQNDTLHQALYENNHEAIHMNNLIHIIEKTSIQDIWFHIVNKDGISFYRSWTNKRLDSIKEARLDLAHMLENPQPISGISVGIYDITFKALVPIYYKGALIGIVEAISKTNSLIPKMKKQNFDMVVVVDKKYTEQLSYPYTNHFIENYYIATPSVNPNYLELIQTHSLDTLIHNNTYILDTKTNLIAAKTILYDVANEPMAYVLLFAPAESISLVNTYTTLFRSYFIFFLFLSLVGGFIISFYVRRTNLVMTIVNKKLSRQVEEKTQHLQYLAHHDTLTALPNRLLFIDRLKQAILHANKNNTSLSVLFLDLDRFKEINDSFGHEWGDRLLIAISKRLQRLVRPVDTIARLGGDEFIILVEEVTLAETTHLLQKIFSAMEKPIFIEKTPTYTTFSVGISRYPHDGITPEILIRNADTAMYRAKETGKNKYQFYDAIMTEKTMQRLTLEINLRNAIKEDQLVAYFQPQIDAATKKVVGAEALVRWIDPEKGIIPPYDFIPLAEEIGIIGLIDEWMMQRCFKLIKELQSEGLFHGKLSLNLSVQQLEQANFLEQLESFLKKYDFNPHFLELEVTESQIMQNPQAAITTLNNIKNLGISLAIDDFGTGYSSLSYLKRLPIDKLKIDKSFIKDLRDGSEDAAIVKAIIALAGSLSLNLIAEGVETEEQKEFLLKEGCHNIQGYYYAKPLELEEFKTFLKNF
ncbi:MAG: EAL domain-containing protein [Sulfurimonadaceae bacterium]|jgi:diguanylate cyclase (GGDEF)-like protein|nr:EAL domain-containing protein [Sulfurimonadaceae bacterium]